MIRKGFIFLFYFLTTLYVHGQKWQPIDSKWSNHIQVDGDLKEWGDSLRYFYQEQDFTYSLSNDADYLYVAIQVKSKDRQAQAAFQGLTITVNPSGKKKDGPSLIFPIPDRVALRTLMGQEFDQEKDIRKAAISSIRALYVLNFPDILDGPISLENNYGIKAAVKIDSADNLCYESAIRLDQLKLSSNKKGFAVNLRINGIIRTQFTDSGLMNSRRGYPYGYDRYGYGYGYGQRPQTVIREREEPGIWQYLNLAKQP